MSLRRWDYFNELSSKIIELRVLTCLLVDAADNPVINAAYRIRETTWYQNACHGPFEIICVNVTILMARPACRAIST